MAGDSKIKCCDTGLHFKKSFSNFDGLLSYLAENEAEHCTKYIKQRSFTDFGKTLNELGFDLLFFKHKEISPRQRLFQFTNDGTPYVPVTHQRQMFCQHGSDYHAKSKRTFKNKQEALANQDHTQNVKRRFLSQDSYKLDCPARVIISRQIHYTSHKAKSVAPHDRKLASRKLKSCDEQGITWQDVFSIEVPTEACHRNHFIGKDSSGRQPIDGKVLTKLRDLVRHGGLTCTETIKVHLIEYVQTVLFTRSTAPPRSNRRYYPDHKTVYNHIHSTLAEQLCSSDDQVNLKAYLDALPTSDHQHFYRQVTDGEADNFLLVHQTGDQKRLMAKYGNELCLLDATYKTTRYALPLFFVVVPTNTCYQVVGTFMISHETTDCIREAVEHLARWNPEWKPSFWMTDCCAAEINAVESIFPDTSVLLCDFHRLQAWNRFLVKLENGIPKTTAVKLKRDYLIPLGNSSTEAQYRERKRKLLESEEWKAHPKFQAYMTQNWLSEQTCQRWVHCFKTKRLLRSIRTNNGIEALNGSVKRFTKGPRSPSLRQLLHSLLKWHAKLYNTYCNLNLEMSSSNKRYNPDLPVSLHERPHEFSRHVMTRLEAAKQLQEHQYTVTSGANPSCDCLDFQRNSYPCKHMLNSWLSGEDLIIPSTTSNSWWSIDDEVVILSASIPSDHPDTLHPSSPIHDSRPAATEPPLSSPSSQTLDDTHSNKRQKLSSVDRLNQDVNELLKEITGLYHLTQLGEDDAKLVASKLSEVKTIYLSATKTCSNLPLQPHISSQPKKRKRTTLDPNDTALKRRKYKPVKFRSTVGSSSNYIVKDLDSCENQSTCSSLLGNTAFPLSQTQSIKIEKPPVTSPVQSNSVEIPVNIDIMTPTYQLGDDDINMALDLIKDQWSSAYPPVTTQDCLFIQRPKCFDPAIDCNFGEFCQVLHMSNPKHWVAVTNVGARANEIRYFDSLGLPPTTQIMKGIASLVKTPCNKISLRMEAVQRQAGGDDCGVFSIANLVEVLTGGKPNRARFNQSMMREHLFKCLSQQNFTPFPKQLQAVNRITLKDRMKSFKVYCLCRLVHNPDSRTRKDDMVECPACKEWYHFGCHSISPSAYCPVTGEIDAFTCRPCIDRGRAVI